MNFGEKLFKLRTERGIYQKELAEYLEVSIGTISNYENGVHYPDLATLCKFAEYFHVSTDYLLDLTENSMPIDSLNICLSEGCSIGGVLNTILELSQPDRQKLGKYLLMLKTCEELPQKEQAVSRQKQLLGHQKQTIGRLERTIEKQSKEIAALKEQVREIKFQNRPKHFRRSSDI